MSSDADSIIDKLVRNSLRLLLAAAALYYAVHLFLSVALTLIITLSVLGLGSGLFALWRHRRDSW